jgi:hypothetical protein
LVGRFWLRLCGWRRFSIELRFDRRLLSPDCSLRLNRGLRLRNGLNRLLRQNGWLRLDRQIWLNSGLFGCLRFSH